MQPEGRPFMPNPYANSVKFFKAVSLLSLPQGTTIRGLMDALDISRRSVFRLLQALDELGFPLIDEQPKPKTEKTYRLMESYVVQLPNISLPTIGFSAEEKVLLLSILDLCVDMQTPDAIILLNGIRQKVMAMGGEQGV
jgi:predicted DNA-binding transcriptional regulator YafY